MRTHLLYLTLLGSLGACSSEPPVYIGSGLYTFISQEDGTPLEAFSGIDVSVNVERQTFSMNSMDIEFQTMLVARSEDQWMESCPTNLNAVQLETVGLQDAPTIEDELLEEPLLFADGCVGDQGETATRLWLSTVAYQDTNNTLGEGLYLLELSTSP